MKSTYYVLGFGDTNTIEIIPELNADAADNITLENPGPTRESLDSLEDCE